MRAENESNMRKLHKSEMRIMQEHKEKLTKMQKVIEEGGDEDRVEEVHRHPLPPPPITTEGGIGGAGREVPLGGHGDRGGHRDLPLQPFGHACEGERSRHRELLVGSYWHHQDSDIMRQCPLS